jgi:Family of unknown function (DUF6600)
MSHRWLVLTVLMVCLGAGRLAVAQAVPRGYATPAHVSVVQGTATLERNGQAEAVTENLPLLEGDRLRTEDGRLEVILPDASVFALDHDSTLDLLAGGLMRLLDGRMVFIAARQGDAGQPRDYQVDAPAGVVRFLGSGDYRISATIRAGVASLDVAVVWGTAVVEADGRSVQVPAGQRTVVTDGEGVASIRAFNAAAADDFYAWEDGLQAERVGAQSDAYLPPDLQVYGGAFDRDGTWDDQPEYGWVWYPRVSADWRPYYDGFWQPYSWGWTWVGAGSWVWPTHHYGRWGHAARGWFWIPEAQWGPAWVSWGYAGDYVSWCPLGDDDSPVFGLSFGLPIGAGRSPWLGWTVMSRGAFDRAARVPLHALRGDRLRAVDRASFTVRRTGPTVPTDVLARRRGAEPASTFEGARPMAGPRQESSRGIAAIRGGARAGDRPSVAQRPWTDNAASPYGRAQEVAGERVRQFEPGAVSGSRAYDTRPFESRSPMPLPYPDRFRPAQGPRPSVFPSPAGRPSYSMPAPAVIRPAVPPPAGVFGGHAPGGVPRGAIAAPRPPARGGHGR